MKTHNCPHCEKEFFCNHEQPRKPLTDERVSEIVTASIGWSVPQSSHYCLARAIESAHGIKE